MVERVRRRRPTTVAPAHRGLRTCVGCKRRDERPNLLRVAAIRRDGSVYAEPDVRRALPGRGAWLHPTADCLMQAVRRRALQRGLLGVASAALDIRSLQEHLAGEQHEIGRRSGTKRPEAGLTR